MKPALAERYDVRVPRYTSYPTAPHFDDDVDGGVYAAWLASIEPHTDLSFYFHIPFCASMCWFCGCHTKVVNRYAPVADYVDVMLEEIDWAARTLPGHGTVRHLHWGGGSPTMLAAPDCQRLFDRLHRRFDIDTEAEIAVELDPRTASEESLRALGSLGVTRASIGVQDFHPEVQQAINRIQPFAVTKRVVDGLRRHGITRLNLDLMYGLPSQTPARMEAMVDLAVDLRPSRVALFGYAHVPWMKPHQRLIEEDQLPTAYDRWQQVQAAAARLAGHGYVAIGLDHFARPDDGLAGSLGSGRLHRNFQGYTTDSAPVLLGFGASAIGALPQGYVQNTQPLRDYAARIRAGEAAVVRGRRLSADDRLRGAVIERLMCDLEADIDTLCRDFGAAAGRLDGALESLSPMVEDGVCTVDGRVVRVSETGRPFLRLVAAAFDAYLQPGERRHARSV